MTVKLNSAKTTQKEKQNELEWNVKELKKNKDLMRERMQEFGITTDGKKTKVNIYQVFNSNLHG